MNALLFHPLSFSYMCVPNQIRQFLNSLSPEWIQLSLKFSLLSKSNGMKETLNYDSGLTRNPCMWDVPNQIGQILNLSLSTE